MMCEHEFEHIIEGNEGMVHGKYKKWDLLYHRCKRCGLTSKVGTFI